MGKSILARCAQAGLVALAAVTFAGTSQAEVKIRFGWSGNEDHPTTQGLQRFVQLVKNRSAGDIQIDLFIAGQLGGEKEMAEQVKLGSLQGTMVINSVMSAWVPETQIFDLPFIFRDEDHAFRTMSGPLVDDVSALYAAQGFHVSAFWVVGTRHPMGKVSVKTPDDVKGLKMRVTQSPLHLELWQSLGANPTPIPHPEIYNSVQTGVVDFLDNSISTYWFAKFYEVAPYFTYLGHIYAVSPLLFNETFWKGLSPEQQAIIDQAARDAGVFQNHLVSFGEEKALANAAANGAIVEVITDKSAWIAAMQPIWESWAPKVGGMDKIKALAESE